jgi:hypothetical protein
VAESKRVPGARPAYFEEKSTLNLQALQVGCWLVAVGGWLAGAGCWLLAGGCQGLQCVLRRLPPSPEL